MNIDVKPTINDLDRKIIIREIKIKGKNKTIVSGMSTHSEFINQETIVKIVKDVKTQYGCGSTIDKDVDNKTIIMFQGNQKENVIKYFKAKYPKIVLSV